MCTNDDPDTNRTRERYASDILALQERLTFRTLATLPEVTYRVERADGLTTLGLRTDQLTTRHLLGMQGFRLAQYLRLGWVCSDAIASRAMFCEPTQALRDDDLHLVTLDGQGRILGYLGLAGVDGSLLMADPERAPFPVEVAHGVNLAEVVPALATTPSDQVRELKRFVHRRSMTDKLERLRVTVELLLAAGSVVLDMHEVRLLVGDVEEHVALRHLMIMGLETRLVEGTRPALEERHYLHHAYTERAAVRPFVADVPSAENLGRQLRLLEELLESPDPVASLRALVSDFGGNVERVAA
ncbi:MAG TPA: hypothetical protein VFG72_15695 [Marmoricola sp.]|nr:hypothetical protein [Marmoricola sp.]